MGRAREPMRWAAAGFALVALLGAARARAQQEPVGEPAEGRTEEPADIPARDPAELDDAWARAMEAFVAHRWEEAAAGFENVAARTVEPGRRTAAAELAGEARRRAAEPPAPSIALDAPPPSPPQDVPPPPAPAPAPEPESEPEGPGEGPRIMLLVGTTLLGVGFYGWSLPVALDIEDDARALVGTYLLTAGSSFFLPYFLTRDAEITWGMTTSYLYGGYYGIFHGSLLYALFAGDDGNDRAAIATMLSTSLVEGLAGYAVAAATDLDAGDAHAISTGGLAGMGWGLLGAALAAGKDLKPRPAAGIALLGAIGGSVGGWALNGLRSWTWGDVEMIQNGALLGAYVGWTGLVLADSDDVRVGSGVVLVTSLGGAILADRLVSGYDVEAWQALLVGLGTYAGGLAGAGVAFVAGANEPKTLLTVSVLGAIAGYGITFGSVDPRAEGEAAGEDGPTVGGLAPWLGPNGGRGVVLQGTF